MANTMQATTDVIIIGGGVIGCSIAYYLRKMNVGVTVLERGEIGGQASGAAAGLLAPLGPLSGPGPLADLVLAGFALFPALVLELEAATGLRLGYEQTGALRILRSARRLPHLRKRLENWQVLGLQMYWLDGDEARQQEPLLAPDICAAIYAPQEAQIEATQLVQAFAHAATRLGAHIYARQAVTGLLTERTRVIGVRTAQGEILACDHLILAAGAWSVICNEWLNVALPVNPLHGQLLSFPQVTPSLKHIVFGEATYLAPRGNRIIVGATREAIGFESQVTEERNFWLSNTAIRLVPVLTDSRIEAAWAGVRPQTPDNRPILGPLPGWENVTVAAGHNSIGIMLSAITGQCITELVATGQVPQIIRPFSVARFL